MDMIRKMLCVNQNDRWTARQLLSHAWITAGDEELQAKDLSKSIEAMKKYKAKMRFKAVAKAIMATKRMQNAFKVRPKVVEAAASESSIPLDKTQMEASADLAGSRFSINSLSSDACPGALAGSITPTSTLNVTASPKSLSGVKESVASSVVATRSSSLLGKENEENSTKEKIDVPTPIPSDISISTQPAVEGGEKPANEAAVEALMQSETVLGSAVGSTSEPVTPPIMQSASVKVPPVSVSAATPLPLPVKVKSSVRKTNGINPKNIEALQSLGKESYDEADESHMKSCLD